MAAADNFGAQRIHKDVDRADLYGGPNVVIPPSHLMASLPRNLSSATMSNQHIQEEVVSSEEESSQVDTAASTPPIVTSDDFALAFDIDGVFVKGGEPIPEALEAMKYINGENPYGIKV
jgi:hypothetical protein